MRLQFVASDDFDKKSPLYYMLGGFSLKCLHTGKNIVLRQECLAQVNEIITQNGDYRPSFVDGALLGGALAVATDSVVAGMAGAVMGSLLGVNKMHLLQLVFDDGRSLFVKASTKNREKLKRHAKSTSYLSLSE